MTDYSGSAAGRSKSYTISRIALMAAVMCILSPLAIPVGPVPISLATLVLYLSVFILGWKMTSASCLLYILLGVAGLPVFAGFSGGIGKIAGPTGGYIIGYVPMIIIAGIFIAKSNNRAVHFAGLIAGTAVLYALGTAWYCAEAGSALVPALGACVIPFIPGDLVKIAVAMIFGPAIRKRLEKAGLLK